MDKWWIYTKFTEQAHESGRATGAGRAASDRAPRLKYVFKDVHIYRVRDGPAGRSGSLLRIEIK